MNVDSITFEELMSVSFRRCDPPTHLAGGQLANNRVDLDYGSLRKHPRLLGRVISQLCDLIQPYEPEFITAVPDGATPYIGLVSVELSRREDRDVFGVYLDKRGNAQSYWYRDSIDFDTVNKLQRGALLEDVINRRKSTQGALRVPVLGSKIVAVAAILDRGMPGEYTELTDLPVHSIAQRPIKSMLPARSPYWRYAK